MSRRNSATKRSLVPDTKFKSQMVAKFINHLMFSGKKAVAEKIFYKAIEIIHLSNKKKKAIELFEKALEIVSPAVEVKARRVGGATYQVPVEVRPDRKATLSMRWIINASRNRKEKDMHNRIASELLDILDGRGASLKKRDDMHKMAEANKAFAHFRW